MDWDKNYQWGEDIQSEETVPKLELKKNEVKPPSTHSDEKLDSSEKNSTYSDDLYEVIKVQSEKMKWTLTLY